MAKNHQQYKKENPKNVSFQQIRDYTVLFNKTNYTKVNNYFVLKSKLNDSYLEDK